jgi:DNA-binding transcriptional regulator YdaS (Cro superfamily)
MITSNQQLAALNRAIEIAGSQNKLARALGISTTSVWKMVNQAKRMSHQFVLAAEAATGVSRHQLRPDIYPIEPPPPPTASRRTGGVPAAENPPRPAAGTSSIEEVRS